MHGHECRKDAFSALQRLSQTQEKQLTEWILIQDALGLPPTHSQIRQFAQRMLAVKGDHTARKTLDASIFKTKSCSSDPEVPSQRLCACQRRFYREDAWFSGLDVVHRVGFLSLLTDSSPVGKQNFLSCYQKAREQALTVSNIKGGWKATDCVVDPEALARSEGSAKAQLQIQALETQLAAVKPKKEEGGHEPEFEVRQY
ncbi:Tc5 transposase DNA-binding domain-containing protein [Hirsutella rhossiliensis]